MALRTLVEGQEQFYRRLTDFYIGMISDLKTSKTDILKCAIDALEKNMAFINDSDLDSEDKHAALDNITEKISDLASALALAKK